MIYKMYSIFDLKVGAFMPPFYARALGEATRSVVNELSNPGSNLSKHPGDFGLWSVGEFDDATGVVAPAKPALVCSLTELVDGVD